MNQEKYSFERVSEIIRYNFISEGPKGIIKKAVIYQLIGNSSRKIYNLGFGDWEDEEKSINDLVKTNNRDSKKVLTTVAETAVDFLADHPTALIYLQGSTPARTRLYQMGISSIIDEIEGQYTINGYFNDQWEPFKKGINYEAFLVSRK
jgi:hypothetical protein